MNALDQLRRLWAHAAWADTTLLAALRAAPDLAHAWREYSHILGAEEVWLSRLERRPARSAIWPSLDAKAVEALQRAVVEGYAAYLARLTAAALDERVSYTNSAGLPFDTAVGDILLHVMLHGQYHRGKVNLLLRQSSTEPAPTDFISFVRGVPAATTR